MTQKLIFLDIDGTLTSAGSNTPPESAMKARRLGVTGWVRNLPEGGVEMEAQGKTARVRQFLIRLKSQPHIHIAKTEIAEILMLRDEKRFHVVD